MVNIFFSVLVFSLLCQSTAQSMQKEKAELNLTTEQLKKINNKAFVNALGAVVTDIEKRTTIIEEIKNRKHQNGPLACIKANLKIDDYKKFMEKYQELQKVYLCHLENAVNQVNSVSNDRKNNHINKKDNLTDDPAPEKLENNFIQRLSQVTVDKDSIECIKETVNNKKFIFCLTKKQVEKLNQVKGTAFNFFSKKDGEKKNSQKISENFFLVEYYVPTCFQKMFNITNDNFSLYIFEEKNEKKPEEKNEKNPEEIKNLITDFELKQEQSVILDLQKQSNLISKKIAELCTKPSISNEKLAESQVLDEECIAHIDLIQDIDLIQNIEFYEELKKQTTNTSSNPNIEIIEDLKKLEKRANKLTNKSEKESLLKRLKTLKEFFSK